MQKIVSKGSSKAADEFVETEYYQDLNCADKQHHTVPPLLCLATYSSPKDLEMICSFTLGISWEFSSFCRQEQGLSQLRTQVASASA